MAVILPVLAIWGACSFYGWTILKPYFVASRDCPRRFQYYTVDWLALSVYLAVPLSLVGTANRLTGRMSETEALWITISCSLLSLYCWFRSVTTLSRLGIADGYRRSAFTLFIFPVAVLGSAFGLPAWIVWLFSSLYSPILFGMFVVYTAALVCAYKYARHLEPWVCAGRVGEKSGIETFDAEVDLEQDD